MSHTYWVHYMAPYYVSGDDGHDNAEAWLDPARPLINEGVYLWGDGDYRVLGQIGILFRDSRYSTPKFPADLVLHPSKVVYMHCRAFGMNYANGVRGDLHLTGVHPGGSDTYAFVDGHAETAGNEPIVNWFNSRGVAAYTYPPKASWRLHDSEIAADKADWWVWPWYPGPRPAGLNGCTHGCGAGRAIERRCRASRCRLVLRATPPHFSIRRVLVGLSLWSCGPNLRQYAYIPPAWLRR